MGSVGVVVTEDGIPLVHVEECERLVDLDPFEELLGDASRSSLV